LKSNRETPLSKTTQAPGVEVKVLYQDEANGVLTGVFRIPKAHARQFRFTIATNAAHRPVRLGDKACPVVEADGFDVDACRVSQRANGEAFQALAHPA
jgi:hypothetical protein